MGGKGSSMNNMLTIVWISWWMLGTYSGSDYGVLEIRKILGSAAVHLDSGIHRKRRSFVFVRKHVSICGSFAAGEFSERVRIWSYRLQTPNILLNRSHHFLAICIKQFDFILKRKSYYWRSYNLVSVCAPGLGDGQATGISSFSMHPECSKTFYL